MKNILLLFVFFVSFSQISCDKESPLEKERKEMNKELLGMWVNHLECDAVVRKDDKILICRTVEEAQIV